MSREIDVVDNRRRPARGFNTIRLTLERGDGECIDIGEIPELDNSLAIAQFIVALGKAHKRCGYYDHHQFDWSQRTLDFHFDALPGKP